MKKLMLALMMLATHAFGQVVQYGQIVKYNTQIEGGVNRYQVYF